MLTPDVIPKRTGRDALWLARNTPYFECSDPAIQDIYYFRWDVYRKHIKATPDGFVVTEFLPDVPWAGTYNTVSATAGHHLYEGRWLSDPTPLDDYSRFWVGPRATPRRYSAWLADAMCARALVTGDTALPVSLLDALITNDEAWDAEQRDESGLYWQVDDRDGMEYQISGSGLRPTINSYLYGDAVAIARIADWAGQADVAAHYRAKAARLKALVQACLWDEKAGFFKTLPTRKALEHQAARYGANVMGPSYPPGALAGVRELQGYVPWYFNLPDPGYERAWEQLTDPLGFWGMYGPSTAERRHPFWLAAPTVHQHDCLWRGSSWPYATSQVLVALANLLNDYVQNVVGKQTYLDLLRAYTRSQRLIQPDGRVGPWIDESLDPDTGAWVTRETLMQRGSPLKDRGRDYNHSTYCDLVITGYVGLRPRADAIIEVHPLVPEGQCDYFCLDQVRYHGHRITILYDRTGHRYGERAGLHVYADGARIGTVGRLERLMAPLPPP